MQFELGFLLEIIMSFEQLKLTDAEAQQFLSTHYDTPVTEVTGLSGGNWSQAFGFKCDDNDRVVRFGKHSADYIIDQFASRFAADNLPIPRVLEVGEFSDGYFAISERAFGTMIDDLGHEGMKRIIPSLMATLDAMRAADISETSGFGALNADGKSKFDSWREMLLDVNSDESFDKIPGWRKGLKESPVGDSPFNEAYARLVELSVDLPEDRSLIHNDLMHFNVLTNNNRITAVFDWANAMYGDFLYDLAMFVFWEPMHDPIKDIDWKGEALKHFEKIGLEVPQFERRLQCCMIHLGLGSMAYYGFTKDWTWLEPVAIRTLEIAKQSH